MKVIVKLTLSFLAIASLVLMTGLFSSSESEKVLRESIERHSRVLANDVMQEIDKQIYSMIMRCRTYAEGLYVKQFLIDSNREFEVLDDMETYMNEKNREWVSARKGRPAPFISGLTNNSLSRRLKDNFIVSYEKEYGFKVFLEVFVTNRYGANCAQTQMTSDYVQSDEEWWQNARQHGIYIEDVAYDDSVGDYTLDICIRVDGDDGDFLGIMKASISFDLLAYIIKENEPVHVKGGEGLTYETTHFDLLTKEGKSIYSTQGSVFLEDLRGVLVPFFCREDSHKHRHSYSMVDERNGVPEVFFHTHSNGYKDFKGLRWILAVQHEEEEIFASVEGLKRTLVLISFIATLLAVLVGFLVARSISVPIMKLRDATFRIGKGELDIDLEVVSNDEIGDLTRSFMYMVSSIRDKQKSLVDAKAELEEWSNKLEQQVEKRTMELKNAQSQLIQAEKMRAVGRMASGVAHEVRNPLGIILQGVNYLETEIPKTEEGLFNIIEMIKGNVERADNIVSSLVDFSRQTELILKPEELNPILKVSLSLVKHRIDLEKIKVVQELKDNLPRVMVDRGKLEQVFINLLLNGCQSMPNGGTIFIRSYQKELKKAGDKVGNRKDDYFKLGEKAVIAEVEDTGVGMSERTLKKIFDPFFTTKGPQGGAGLGMSITKSIIDMHKSIIEAESIEGKGTRFTLILKPVNGR